MMASLPLVFSPEVEAAITDGKPIVALESTIVTHGMPYPDNVETARAVEAEIRSRGAVPATIAVLEGKIRIGLDAETLDRLGTMTGVMKLSRADIAFALATGRPGSTTVAATMISARLAGIEVFATGGIGGVHQGAEESFDISADLEELGRTSVIVVAAGAKAILDLPKTLEVLETKGVPVVGYRTDEFPAFWSRGSGLKAPLRLDSAAEIAAFQKARELIGIGGGMLIANPVPETDEIPAVRMQGFIAASLASAKEAGISAKEVTPYLLADMFERTAGSSLKTNIALVMNNARLAADIAKALKA
ncbi:pseudouridine-5'-phosphate glycosidase [Pleomorphomonas koreensis]|uniref:pseudouridine-5'-phosphate glycosidase n=1 Tax=Pleomorphomonas koreensis TaxID=257440 RepID=UPI000479582F|nr:pseudouridine-5'-phosphate glycosidase [Pleomorphomonas koreensis]